MSGLLSYLGFKTELKNTPVRALPASWYLSTPMYQLERRAIFSRRWLFITHQSRFPNSGDFLRYSIAGYDIILVKDRTSQLRAFHNVCRHRAYTVVEKDQGNAKILSCRYHGWSYGLDGKLAKAPKYDTLDFDKTSNGLFPINLKVDVNGFIWINLDSKQEIKWEDTFQDVDRQARFQDIDFNDYTLDHTYELTAAYNWKMASDNFNECYHCPTTHPDIPNFLQVDAHDMEFKGDSIQHDHGASEEAIKKGLCVNSTYYLPNSSMSVSKHFMMIQKFMPRGPSETQIEYEIYRNKNSSEEDFHLIADMYARVMAEDKALCTNAQQNLGVYTSGELHPRWEKGPLHFQQSIRDMIYEHVEKEKKAGEEIWPARQVVENKDEALCRGLTSNLEW